MKVVMLVANPCTHDARVMREAEAVAAAGHTVVVLAEQASGLQLEVTKNGVTYRRLHLPWARKKEAAKNLLAERASAAASTSQTKPHTGSKLSNFKRKTLGWLAPYVPRTGLMLAQVARYFTAPGISEKPDIVHAHDLVTLLAGARIAKQTGAKLIYDSHELETGRNARYAAYEKWLRARYERALIAKTDAVITVSDSIADYLAKLYNIERPVVVLNAPDSEAGAASGDHVRQRLGLSADIPLAIYVGSVTINRGLENAVRALPHAPLLHLAAVGPRSGPVAALLLCEAAALGVSDRFHLIDPVPHNEVTSFIRSADVSLILIQDVCLSYRFCFPNKLLESIVAGVPVLAAKLVELERIIVKTNAGLTVDQTDPIAIAKGAMEIAQNRHRYAPDTATIGMIQDTYSWARQSEVLLALYDRLNER